MEYERVRVVDGYRGVGYIESDLRCMRDEVTSKQMESVVEEVILDSWCLSGGYVVMVGMEWEYCLLSLVGRAFA